MAEEWPKLILEIEDLRFPNLNYRLTQQYIVKQLLLQEKMCSKMDFSNIFLINNDKMYKIPSNDTSWTMKI